MTQLSSQYAVLVTCDSNWCSKDKDKVFKTAYRICNQFLIYLFFKLEAYRMVIFASICKTYKALMASPQTPCIMQCMPSPLNDPATMLCNRRLHSCIYHQWFCPGSSVQIKLDLLALINPLGPRLAAALLLQNPM